MGQWVFSFEHLQRTPSSEDQVPLRIELAERNKAVDFMFRVGLTLGLSLTPLYTAATYLHRFYMRRSLFDYNYHEMAMACLFLAAKIEETSRKISDIARMAMAKARGYDLDKHDFNSEESRRECERWQQTIQLREEVLIDALCFDFLVRHPQRDIAELFNQWLGDTDTEQGEFILAATWTVANDSFRTPICVLAESNVAAYACFLVAAQTAGRDTISEFFALRDQEGTPSSQPSYAEIARDILNVERCDFDVVLDCMKLLRDYYTSTPEQAGRFVFVEELASLPLPVSSAEFFAPCERHTNGYANGSGAESPGNSTPQSDGSKTPGAFSVSGLSQGTLKSV